VIDSRAFADRVRRRRACCHCQHRFTTFEIIVDLEAERERARGLAGALREMARALEVW